MIGGELFGIIGIIFFIPLTAVVIELVKEDACRRLRTKETPNKTTPRRAIKKLSGALFFL